MTLGLINQSPSWQGYSSQHQQYTYTSRVNLNIKQKINVKAKRVLFFIREGECNISKWKGEIIKIKIEKQLLDLINGV